MKRNIIDIVNEAKGQKIDDQWISDEKPLQTKDGRTAVVTDIDQSKVPNILKGQVLVDKKMVDFEWDDTGKCLKASDALGNPQTPTDKDTLVKGA